MAATTRTHERTTTAISSPERHKMKFFSLAETAAGSGLFALSGAALDAPGTSVALTRTSKTVAAGLRVAVAPYRAMSGMPAPVAPVGAEQGQAYELLIEQADDAGVFVTEKQILVSETSDAAMTAYALQLFYGRRVALTPQREAETDAKPDEANPAPSNPGSVSSSGAQTSGGSVSSGGSASSGGAVTSGGSVSSAGAGSSNSSGVKGA